MMWRCLLPSRAVFFSWSHELEQSDTGVAYIQYVHRTFDARVVVFLPSPRFVVLRTPPPRSTARPDGQPYIHMLRLDIYYYVA